VRNRASIRSRLKDNVETNALEMVHAGGQGHFVENWCGGEGPNNGRSVSFRCQSVEDAGEVKRYTQGTHLRRKITRWFTRKGEVTCGQHT